ncbi:UDP-glucose 6-dehydrogenase (EC [Olavius algarvensis associated proteobacterium Delta 3]|nr:UDP-glucose 6-dehydrogenase (EC [Olavius algarvensis associated proteobacterium Delta 3]CAB5123976.1 UDP-glucose 6-dehydrogenase (EC [Olavius algarvensis associated proteobacterium Delta 3]
MRLTIVGTGYVGLVTGTGFANLGNDVICLDIDEAKVDALQNGVMPIYEPGLEELFRRNVKSGRLQMTTDPALAIQESDIIFICVGTPTDENLQADLSAVDAVARAIGTHMSQYTIIVNKSTVPVGTADRVRGIIEKTQKEPIEFDVVSNPEFLREGAAVKDFENPDRIIIGSDSPRAVDVMNSLYRARERTDKPIMVTDVRSAELIKYASNAMLATRISFMNQLSHLCEKTGADIKAVGRGLGLDKRVGSRFLQAGVGYGGSCFPKDVKALISTLKQYECEADLFEAVHRINEGQVSAFLSKIESVLDVEGSTVAVWGISFKPKTDDIREAPALKIIKRLQERGAIVRACDPAAVENAKQELGNVELLENPYETIRDCDALVVVTEWNEFRNLDMRAVKILLKQPILIDGRNIYDPEEMRDLGFTYVGVGRGQSDIE